MGTMDVLKNIKASHQNVGKVASSIGHEDITIEEDQEV
jgi:hypothetical protein